ncbi:MAG: mercury(II) reductase [Alphaproteobacteria bacterium]|nr:mercury(II) reductase [Alphaproteobacteria bacterium]
MSLAGVANGGPYDLAVIGAGSAGFSAAITAAEQSAHVALIGHGTIGGTCVNVGCVPSKTMLRAVETLHHANAAGRFAGIQAAGHVTDWGAAVAQKDALVGALRQSKYRDLLSAYPSVDYLEGRASFSTHGLQLDGAAMAADRIIIATGSQPNIPAIPGLAEVPYLTSTSALEMAQLPRSMLIIGAGYIGCELAQMLSRAGVEVTILSRRRLLAEGEPEISDALRGYLRDEGLGVLDGLDYESIARTEAGIALNLRLGGEAHTLCAERLLLSAGRRPNTDGLGLDEAGIGTLNNGGIAVDGQMRTSRPGVYAAGDVTGRDQFVYMAAHGARIAAQNALNGDSLKYDNNAMPAVVFTDPQVATVGLTEAAARAQGYDVVTSLLPLEYLPRALAARDTRGLFKLVADRGTKRLLGAHILAPEGADSIQTAALAIRQGLTYVELGEMIFPYLTTVEGLKLAAQAFEKDIAKLSCCAG